MGMKRIISFAIFCFSTCILSAQDFSVVSAEVDCGVTNFSLTQAANPLGTLCYDTNNSSGNIGVIYWNSSFWAFANMVDGVPDCSSLTTANVGVFLPDLTGTSGNIVVDYTNAGTCTAVDTSPSAPIPALGDWGVMCLGLILSILSVSALRQRSIALERG